MLLFCSLDFLFRHVLVAVAVVIFLKSLIMWKNWVRISWNWAWWPVLQELIEVPEALWDLGSMHLPLWVGFLDMVWFGTVYSNVLFKFCDYLKKKTNKQEKTRKTLLCALINDDLIQENIISYCFLRCYIYVSLLLTRLHMRLNGGMCLLQTSRDTDDVKRRVRPRVNPDLL